MSKRDQYLDRMDVRAEGFAQGIRTATDFVFLVENVLGFAHDVGPQRPLWKCRSIEAGKLKKKMATKPALYTFENLLLAVEYCRKKKMTPRSPAALCFFVEEAMKAGADTKPVADLDTQIQEAISAERTNSGSGDDVADAWIQRLARATGAGRAVAYSEWVTTRGS